MDDSCQLCQAANEDYRLIYRDEHVFVAMNIEPLKASHVMVMPVRHARQVSDLTPIEAQAFLNAIDRCMETAPKVSPEPSISA